MTTLDAGFVDALREDLLDEAEDAVADHAQALADESGDRFDAYAARNDYDIGHIWQQTTVSGVRRSRGRVSATVSWPALTGLFEYGVGPHVIEGNPTLTFYYDRIDQWITTDSVNWGSETGGIPEARAIRTALQVVGRAMRGE